MTSELPKRVREHKNKIVKGFTARYNFDRLVYYEVHDNAGAAIKRELSLKEWKRAWKVELIEKENPEWKHLYESIRA